METQIAVIKKGSKMNFFRLEKGTSIISTGRQDWIPLVYRNYT